MKAISVHQPGGPEALQYEEVADPQPKAGEALVRLEAVGVNYLDVYHRTGLYPVPPPFTPGNEGAGVVVSVGEGVSEVAAGNRVAWTGVLGGYAELACVPAARLVVLPAGVSTRQAAAAMLQGMTAHYLAHSTRPLAPGDSCLIHAGAGGVGLLLTQVAKMRGARVLSTVSTEAKAALARAAGADEVIRYDERDFSAEVRRLTGGQGVQVVYDSVGKTTFRAGFDCLAPRGMMVLFGQSSGPVAPLDLALLAKGSLFVTRPSLFVYIAAREELAARAAEVLGWVAAGRLALRIDLELPLAQAAEAHRALEGRRTTGKILLLP